MIKRHLYNADGEYKLYTEGTKEYDKAIKDGLGFTKQEALAKKSKKTIKKNPPSLLDTKGTINAK